MLVENNQSDVSQMTSDDVTAALDALCTSDNAICAHCDHSIGYGTTLYDPYRNRYPERCHKCDPIMAQLYARRAELGKAAAIVAKQKEVEQAKQYALKRLAAQVGPEFAECSVYNFQAATESQRRAAELVKGEWWEPKPFTLLCGEPGRGKTHLAIAAYRRAAYNTGEWDIHPIFRKETTFISDWRNAAANRTRFDDLELLSTCTVLVLDDIATAKLTDGSAELLFNVIDTRYSERLATFFTTNYSLADLKNRLGEKLTSRLAGADTCNVIMVEGDNYRFKPMRRE